MVGVLLGEFCCGECRGRGWRRLLIKMIESNYPSIGPLLMAATTAISILACLLARRVRMASAHWRVYPMHVWRLHNSPTRVVGSAHATHICLGRASTRGRCAWHAAKSPPYPRPHTPPFSLMVPHMRATGRAGRWSIQAVYSTVWRFGHCDPSAHRLVH